MGSPDTGAREPLDDATYYAIVNAVTSRWREEGSAPRGYLVDTDGLRVEIEAALAAGVGVPPDAEKSLGSALHEERGDAR